MKLKTVLQTARKQGAIHYVRYDYSHYALFRSNGAMEAASLERTPEGSWLLSPWSEIGSMPESAQKL